MSKEQCEPPFIRVWRANMAKKQNRKRRLKPRNLTHLEHVKRAGSGAGTHKDRKKEASRKACRQPIKENQ